MRHTARFTLAAIVIGVTVSLTATPASACSCMALSDEEALEMFDAVFTGEVIAIREDADTFVWLIEVDAVFNGAPAALTTAETAQSGAACGTTLPVDTPAVFFLTEELERPVHYTASLCSPTRVLEAGAEVLGDVAASPPGPADPSVRTGFDVGLIDDAPEPVEEPTDVSPEEEILDDGEVDLSEQDQAELAAAPPDGAAGAAAENDSSGATPIVIIGLVAMAAAVLVFELRRRAA